MAEKFSLLILGAGEHGRVVKETAEAIGFLKTDFLDDNNPSAIGALNDFGRFSTTYPHAFVGIGNNEKRFKLFKLLISAGFEIPTLIHPTAYISPSATIGQGVIVEPKAIVGANAVVGIGCILAAGSIVDHDAEIGDFAHINTGAICKGGSYVLPHAKLEAGQVIVRRAKKIV